MNPRLNVLLIIIALSICYVKCNDNYLYLVQMDQSSGAACLDGSAPGYYFNKGSGDGAKNFILFFMGGGFCDGLTESDVLDSCLNRSQTNLGSSNLMLPVFPGFSTLSSDPTNNPYYYNWNRILIWYCDGSFHQGYREEPVNHKGQDLYFRGEINTKVMMDHILRNLGMAFADQVILTGGSAGGLATLLWADYLKGLLPSHIQYAAVPDSGFVYDWPYGGSKSTDFRLRKNLIALTTFVNKERPIPVDSRCVETYNMETWQCLYGEYLADFIKTPLFLVNYLYDEWFMANELGETCFNPISLSMEFCFFEHKQNIKLFQDQYVNNIQQILSQKPDWGAWMPACLGHVAQADGVFNNQNYAVPMNSDNILSQSIYQWYNNLGGQEPSKYVFIDSVDWPNNKPCSHKSAIKQFLSKTMKKMTKIIH